MFVVFADGQAAGHGHVGGWIVRATCAWACVVTAASPEGAWKRITS